MGNAHQASDLKQLTMSEKEYIERDAAIKIAESYGLKNGSALGRHSGIADRIAEAISRTTAADVAPVVHGRWVWDSTNDRYACSRCNKEPSGDCNGGCVCHFSDYCPNCGCKMDGE